MILVEDIYHIMIGRTQTAISRRLQRNFRHDGLNLTQEQWAVLVILWQNDGITQQHLCDKTFKEKPSLTRLINNLERNGLVIRVQDENDKRANLIYLTDEGHELKEKATKVAEMTVLEVLDSISEEDVETTKRVLNKVFDNLSEK